jgi:hypothetical protein
MPRGEGPHEGPFAGSEPGRIGKRAAPIHQASVRVGKAPQSGRFGTFQRGQGERVRVCRGHACGLGAPVLAASKLLRYASTEITRRVYTDVDPRWLREQVNRTSLKLSALVPRVEDSRVRAGERETPDHLGKSP